MNAVRCPKCGQINATTENFCLNCGASVLNLPPTSYVSLPPQSHPSFPSQSFPAPVQLQIDDARGAKTVVWYKVFCVLIMLASLFPVVLGLTAMGGSGNQPNAKEQSDAFNGGVLFVLYGGFYFVFYLVALIMPRRPVTWVFGIVTLALGLTSCFLPFAIPLFVFWLKPETKAYFGRN